MRETSRPVRHDKCSKLLAVGKRSNAMRRFSLKQGKHVTNHILRMRSICWAAGDVGFFPHRCQCADRQVIRSSQLWSIILGNSRGLFQESPDFTDDPLPRSLYQTWFNVRTISSNGNVSWFCFRARCWWLRFLCLLWRSQQHSPLRTKICGWQDESERLVKRLASFCDAPKGVKKLVTHQWDCNTRSEVPGFGDLPCRSM